MRASLPPAPRVTRRTLRDLEPYSSARRPAASLTRSCHALGLQLLARTGSGACFFKPIFWTKSRKNEARNDPGLLSFTASSYKAGSFIFGFIISSGLQMSYWPPLSAFAGIAICVAPTAALGQGTSPVNGWQTYCASELGREHVWNAPSRQHHIERLPEIPNLRTGYGYVRDGKLVARDMARGLEYQKEGSAFSAIAASKCPQFRANEHTFKFDGTTISACDASGVCNGVQIHPGTFPFVFAEAAGTTLAATNYGDVLMFRDGAWCRAGRQGDTYSCDANEPMVAEPRKVRSTAPSSIRAKP